MASQSAPLQPINQNAAIIQLQAGGSSSSGVKRLEVGTRVSGSVGNFIPNHDNSKRRRLRERWFGYIISAVGTNKYLVRFDNGEEKECASSLLKKERLNASVPPDIPITATQPDQYAPEDVTENVDAENQEEEEHLPETTPDCDEEEVEQENNQENIPPGVEQTEAAATTRGVSQPPAIPRAVADPNGRMPGQLPTASEVVQNDYASVKRRAQEKIASLIGTEVIIKASNNRVMTWTVVANHEPDGEDILGEKESSVQYGLKQFSSKDYSRCTVFAEIFLKLTFKDWQAKVQQLNMAIVTAKANVKKFTNQEFLVALGLIIGSADFSQVGKELFSRTDKKNTEFWESIAPLPHFEAIMPYSRFKDFRRFLPEIFADYSKEESDPWFRFSTAVDDFNEIRRTLFQGSRWISIDESMSAWRPRKTALGGLPNISFITRKPEPLGLSKVNFFFIFLYTLTLTFLLPLPQVLNSKQVLALLQE
ncbi:MAG: hypothetical protein ACK51L_02220 [bacterium]|jgi:hypothetical protein